MGACMLLTGWDMEVARDAMSLPGCLKAGDDLGRPRCCAGFLWYVGVSKAGVVLYAHAGAGRSGRSREVGSEGARE